AYFGAQDGSTGFELWKSDGSEAGTVLVRDILPGSVSSQPLFLTDLSGQVLLLAEGPTGRELWKSDGTADGTALARDLRPATLGGSHPDSCTAVEGVLFFLASDPLHGRELWRSNGTEAGTVLVKDIWPGERPGTFDRPDALVNVNGVLFFVADDGVLGRELW